MSSDDDDFAGRDLAAEPSVVDNPQHEDSLANSDVDVVSEEELEQDDRRSEFEASSRIMAKPTKTKFKAQAVSDGPSARKKSRRVVASDPETEDEHLDVDVDGELEDDNENDYLPKPTTKGSKGQGKASTTALAKGGAKRKARADSTSEVPTINRKRPKPTPKSDEVSIDVGDGSSTHVSIAGDIHTNSKLDSPSTSTPRPQQPPKKQKLPTIKKVKLPNLNTPTSTIVKDPVVLVSKPTQDGVRKTLSGTIDIDLSNKSIYEEIFSKTVCYYSKKFFCFFVHISVGLRRWWNATGWSQPTDKGGRKTERVEPTKR